MIKEKPVDLYNSSPPYVLIAGISLVCIVVAAIFLTVLNWNSTVTIEELNIESNLSIREQKVALESYLASKVSIPEGEAAYAHLKVENFSDGTNALYMNPIEYETIDNLYNSLNNQDNILNLNALVPDDYKFIAVSALPFYKELSRDLENQFLEQAYADDEMIHVFFYEPDYSRITTTLTYDKFILEALYVEKELVNHFSASEILEYEYLKIGEVDGIFYTQSDVTGEKLPRHIIHWYHEEDGSYQYITLMEKDMNLMSKDEMIQLANTIEDQYIMLTQ